MAVGKTARRWPLFVCCCMTAQCARSVRRHPKRTLYIYVHTQHPCRTLKITCSFICLFRQLKEPHLCLLSAGLHRDMSDCPWGEAKAWWRGRGGQQSAMKGSFAQQNNERMKRGAFKTSDRTHCFDIYSNATATGFHVNSMERLQVLLCTLNIFHRGFSYTKVFSCSLF